jgi:hypothetical protein
MTERDEERGKERTGEVICSDVLKETTDNTHGMFLS